MELFSSPEAHETPTTSNGKTDPSQQASGCRQPDGGRLSVLQYQRGQVGRRLRIAGHPGRLSLKFVHQAIAYRYLVSTRQPCLVQTKHPKAAIMTATRQGWRRSPAMQSSNIGAKQTAFHMLRSSHNACWMCRQEASFRLPLCFDMVVPGEHASLYAQSSFL